MLQSMGLQRGGHDLATENQQLNSEWFHLRTLAHYTFKYSIFKQDYILRFWGYTNWGGHYRAYYRLSQQFLKCGSAQTNTFAIAPKSTTFPKSCQSSLIRPHQNGSKTPQNVQIDTLLHDTDIFHMNDMPSSLSYPLWFHCSCSPALF